MNRTEKQAKVASLVDKFNEGKHLYFVDISGLNAQQSSDLRRTCFNQDIELMMVKNTFIKKAFDQIEGDQSEITDELTGSTSIMFSEVGNKPAKLIKEFRKGADKPILKCAYVEETVYVGDDQLKSLVAIKSKEELIGDVLTLLQSPATNLMSALQSGGNNITGVLKTLSNK